MEECNRVGVGEVTAVVKGYRHTHTMYRSGWCCLMSDGVREEQESGSCTVRQTVGGAALLLIGISDTGGYSPAVG